MFQRWKRPSLLILFLAGCTGTVERNGGPGPSMGGSDNMGGTGGEKPLPPLGPDPGATGACKTVTPGPSPLRRLSRSEYANTVVELFGEQAAVAVNFIREARVNGFDNNAQSRAVSNLLAQEYFETAEKLSTAAVTKLSDLVACDPAGQGEPACLDKFLDGFGKRVWRRPLLPAERESLKQVFTQGRTTTFADGVQAVLQVMLLSPQFMYRVEKGVPVSGADYLRLGPYEVASRLSYLVWGSMPDATLFAAADAGKLSTREEVKAQAQRMLDDPRAARMVTTFAGQWLRLDEISDIEKQAEPYPAFKPELKDAFRGEVEAFFNQVLWKGDGKLDTLLTAPYTFVNEPLAAYYGIKGVTGPAFQQVQLDPKQRVGFLTQAGLMSVLGVNDGGLNSLVYRGLFVRERLFCQPVPDPPPDAQSMNPPVTPATTARESSVARQAISLCGSCHALMDKIGLGFENFDGIGLYRTTDKGKPVDASGELTSTDVDGAFNGAVDLAAKLASSKDAHACLATQWFRYGFGREETAQDSCSLDGLKQVAISSGGNFKELLLALTQTDTFLLRSKGDQP
jgi:Protein of unknown function (DUF1592)/Protein of unknown function (DUF1588)/Protein of unknown function (DUF1595)/Protein of unknown function (DUF1585)/Protein of unknown function (DUF1587)